ncbi:MAG: hypothetical protein JW829_13020 [Pirellulales bacterium]|nr:hypothetical protein [Pirellulales bacterium]
MKTERRHELHTNYLASHLAIWIEKIKPYTTAIILAVGILIIAALIIGYWSNTKSQKEQAAWDQFTYAMTSDPLQVEGLDLQAQEHAGTTMETWSTLTWADHQLYTASAMYLRDRNGSKQIIHKIRDIYAALIEEADSEEIRDRAQLGLARAYEMSNDLDQAQKAYQQVRGKMAGIAKARLEELNRPEVAETIRWLASAEAIVPAAPEGPGTPGQRPIFGTEYDLTPPGGPVRSDIEENKEVDLLKVFEQATQKTESATESDGSTESEGDSNEAPDQPAGNPES